MADGELSPEHALAVVNGKVVAAYRIDGWETRRDLSKAAFIGTLDHQFERPYLGEDVSRYFPKGAQNPLRFVNCPPTDGDLRAQHRETSRVPGRILWTQELWNVV
jgi:hypothetical protein